MRKKIIVIGAGAAGMMAAGSAASQGADVILLEKNEKLGRKLYITGKGRCNVTNNTDIAGLMSQTLTNPRFLNSAFYAMDATDLMDFFEKQGVPLKTERGGRVFPVSDKSSDIITGLMNFLNANNVKIKLGSQVHEIIQVNDTFQVRTHAEHITADAVIIATGGLSYPGTGSTGDGFTFAKALGHRITPTSPSLVPITTAESWVSALEGLSLRNVKVTAKNDSDSTIYEETGEMMFTHTGVTGPIILRTSAFFTSGITAIHIDLKPALSHDQLDKRILRDFADTKNKNFANALGNLLPKRLINTIIDLSKISPDKKINIITKEERQSLVTLLKQLTLTPTGTTGYKEAVITKGGVSVHEVNPSTMMSKKVPHLFFAGEVLDVDAMTGGYNLQIAFSTGWLAGQKAAMMKSQQENVKQI
ncbi:MAG: NAD(P)/FAD-dependent oxidoreductase [Defluviitaleaceae bacterium]|nr:NAD(P)/FAD-dependent oxidoreductase [Defluviitaleaceae bacterium]